MTETSDLVQARRELDQGQFQRALELYSMVSMTAQEPAVRRSATAGAADCCLKLGRAHEALSWIDELRDVAEASGEPNVLEAAAHLSLGDADRCLELLTNVATADAAEWHHPASTVDHLRCLALLRTGEDEAALASATVAIGADPRRPEIWSAVAEIAARSSLDLVPTLDAVRDEDLLQVLSYLPSVVAAGADRILEQLWQRYPGDPRVLTMVTVIGNRLELERAVEWSARLRRAGLAEQCAVLGRAARTDLAASSRVVAAAVANSVFGDPRASDLLAVAARKVADANVGDLLEHLVSLDLQELLDEYVIAAATTPQRALRLAGALLGLDTVDAAVSLAQHAHELATGQPEAWDQAASTVLDNVQRRSLAEAAARRDAGVLAAALTGVTGSPQG